MIKIINIKSIIKRTFKYGITTWVFVPFVFGYGFYKLTNIYLNLGNFSLIYGFLFYCVLSSYFVNETYLLENKQTGD